MKSKTPRTDSAEFGAQEENGPCSRVVHSSIARQLEEENISMRQAISVAVECIEGLDLHLQGNHGLFILMALDKLQPFLK